jgi:hypothetical protein
LVLSRSKITMSSYPLSLFLADSEFHPPLNHSRYNFKNDIETGIKLEQPLKAMHLKPCQANTPKSLDFMNSDRTL